MRRVFVEAVEFSHQIFYPTEWFNVLQPWVKVCSTSHDLPSCKRGCLVHVASSRNDGRFRWQRGRYKSVYLKRKIEKSARCACPPSCVFNCDRYIFCRPLLNFRELKRPRRPGQQERHKFACLTMQTFFACLERAFFIFVHSQTFSSNQRPVLKLCGWRERLTTNVQFFLLIYKFNSRIVITHFASLWLWIIEKWLQKREVTLDRKSVV